MNDRDPIVPIGVLVAIGFVLIAVMVAMGESH